MIVRYQTTIIATSECHIALIFVCYMGWSRSTTTSISMYLHIPIKNNKEEKRKGATETGFNPIPPGLFLEPVTPGEGSI